MIKIVQKMLKMICIFELISFMRVIQTSSVGQPDSQMFKNDNRGKNYELFKNKTCLLFGFGFWSKYSSEQGDESTFSQHFLYGWQGQQKKILFAAYMENIMLISYAELDGSLIEIQHNFALIYSDERQQVSFKFEFYEYEIKWVFTSVVFDLLQKTIYIQLKDKYQQTIDFPFLVNELQVTLGGISQYQKLIFMQNLEYDATFSNPLYNGLFSNLIVNLNIQTSENYFEQIFRNSSLPFINLENNCVYIIQDIHKQNQFSGKIPSVIANQKGDWYALTGWIKHNLLHQFDEANIQVIQIYSYILGQQQDVFYIKYFINKKHKALNNITIYCDYLKFPLKIGYLSKRFTKVFQTESGEEIFQSIQQWHFINYQYQKNKHGILELQFPKGLGILQANFGDDEYESLTNDVFSINIGETAGQQYKFYGYLYSISFFHNSVADQFEVENKGNFEQNQGCFFKCEDCDGPLQNNCLSCKVQQNRIFFSDTKECICQQGYYESSDQECFLISEIYSKEIITEIDFDQQFQCEFGFYFKPGNEFQCFKCPVREKIQFYCLECILNPLTWYIKPYCEFYLQSRGKFYDDSFQIYHHEKQYYFIDNKHNLVFQPFIKDYIEQEGDRLDDNIINHLGKTFFVSSINSFKFFTQKNLLLSNLFLFCNNFPNLLLNCINCINRQQIFDVEQQTNCDLLFELQNIICTQQQDYMNNVTQEQTCGQFCLDCREGLCLRCVNNYEYFISQNGQTCLKNNIPHCLHAGQILKEEQKDFSAILSYFFKIHYSQLTVICERCEDNFVYIISIQECLKLKDQSCFAAIALDIINNEQNQNQTEHFIAYKNETSVYTSTQWCLEYNSQLNKNNSNFQVQKQNSKLFYYGCWQKLQYCEICLQINQTIWVCLKCQIDFKNKVCFENVQQRFENCRDWNIFIDFNQIHKASSPKIYVDESVTNINNILESFKFLTKVYDGDPEIACHYTCLECANNTVCLRCKKNEFGRPQTLSESHQECIECPVSCALCYPRTNQQILEINPFFQNQNFMKYTLQCLPTKQNIEKNSSLFYDNELRRYISCQNGKSCKKQFNIQLNLFCSKFDYDLQLNSLERQLFQTKNILFEDFIKNQFSQFDQKEFYEIANEKSIRIISIFLTMESQKTCSIQDQWLITNKFRENIFSVNIEINFPSETIIQIIKVLKLEGFSSIIIRNLKLQIMGEQQFKVQIFDTPIFEKLYLSNISVFCNRNLRNNFLFSFQNIDEIYIESFQLIANNIINSTIFKIESNQNNQKFQLIGICFFNIAFEHSKFLTASETIKLNIILQEIQINACQFLNSAFVDYNPQDGSQQTTNYSEVDRQFSIIILKQFSAQSANINYLQEFQNSSIFMNLKHFNKIEIENFVIAESNVSNCTLIHLNHQETIVKSFYQTNCTITDSTIFSNFAKNVTQIIFLFQAIELSQNLYSGFLSFFKIINYNTILKSSAEFVKLNISENFSKNRGQDQQFFLNQSLLYISLNKVSFIHTYISRRFGFQEISLVKIENLSIKYTQVLISQPQQLRQLHQRADCLEDNQRNQKAVFNIYAAAIILIEYMNISGIIAMNSPIIYIRSENMEFQRQDNKIVIFRIIAEENLFLIKNPQVQLGIIKVQTTNLGDILIKACNFSKNLLQGYGYDFESMHQSIILNLDVAFQSVKIEDSFFESNIALNSKFSGNYIKSQIIEIKNCQFKKNNLLNYEILQPFILWDFENQEDVVFEDIQNIFKIESQSGNGIFEFQTLLMSNLSVVQSVANQAVGFKLISENYSSIQIANVYFGLLETQVIENDFQLDGVLFIDSSNSLDLSIIIQNITAQSIFLYNQCSLFQILVNSIPTNIEIFNVNVSNISTFSASLLNVDFKNQSNYMQSIKISNIEYSFTTEDWNIYIYKYLYTRMKNNQAFQVSTETTSERTVFKISFGTDIDIKNIQLLGLQFETAFKFNEVQNLNLSNIIILNSITDKKLIYVNELKRNEYLPNQQKKKLVFNNLLVQNVSTSQLGLIYCFGYQRRNQNMKCLKNSSAPLHLQNIQRNIFEKCSFKKENLKALQSLIQLFNIQDEHFIHLNDVIIKKINCSNCLQGLFYIQFIHSQPKIKLILTNFLVLQSDCGLLSCFQLDKINFYNDQNNAINSLNSSFKLQLEISMQNYICQSNIAFNGTCLNINNLKFIIKNSIFMLNKAEFAGGAIYSQNNSNYLFIEKSYICDNQAILGGGVYINNQISIDYRKLLTSIQNNQAFAEGQDISSSSTKLSFQYGLFENLCSIERTQNESFTIDQVSLLRKENIFGFESNYLLFPNGQKINQYKMFDWKNRQYIKLNLNFRILALSQREEKQINLQDSFCNISSGISYNSTLFYTNNFTSFNTVNFNNISSDYNLDELQIEFPQQLESKLLFLEFQCNSISIAQFNQKYPYNYISHHQNYSIRFYLLAFPCQIGEIQNLDSGTCDLCDSDSGFFVLKINQHQCLLKDDISTLQVMPTQLQLRPGFWRPYLDTSIISRCYNLQSNCLGGWIEGDTSCLLGHIGALCEQCDILNRRGDGRFFQTNSYECQNCENQLSSVIIIIIIFIYILIAILLAVISNLQSVRLQLILIRMKILGFRITFQYNYKAILFKLITNHLQILGVINIVYFEIKIWHFNYEQLRVFFNFTTTPSQTLTFKFDCLITDSLNLSIHYIRILFSLLQPFFYIVLIFFFYFLGQVFKKVQFNILFFSITLIYIYIYFLPNLVGKLVQLLSYRDISSLKWILANVAFRYDEQQHFYWMIYFLIPTLILIALLIPLFFFYGLHTNQNLLDKKTVRLKWGYLYCEYNKQTYKWEILRIIKKIILLGLVNYYQNFPLSQVIIIILTLLIYLQLNQYFKPYSSRKLNNVDYQSMKTCLISICVLQIDNRSNLLAISYFQELFFFALNIRIIVIIFQELIHLYLQESSEIFKKQIEQIKECIRKQCPFLKKLKLTQKIFQNQELKEQRIQELFKKLKTYLLIEGKIRLEKAKKQVKEHVIIVSNTKKFYEMQCGQ